LEGEIRQLILAQTGVFPGAVHFVPRGFLVKSSSGKIARVESYRKYKEHISRTVLSDRDNVLTAL
jgi:hypothetical protein